MPINRCRFPEVIRLLLFVGLLAFTACSDVDLRPTAGGNPGSITVVTDSASWEGPIGEALREELGRLVFTLPQPEPAFDLKFQPLSSNDALDRIKRQQNVVFVAPLDDTSNVAQFIKARLDSSVTQAVQKGRVSVLPPRKDLWYRQQLVYYVTGTNEQQVINALQKKSDEIRQHFNQLTRERKTFEMFEKGRQQALEDTLMKHHNFAVNVQHDYIIAQDTANFVRLRRVLRDTWREFFVYYIENPDPSVISPSWIYNVRDSLSQKYIRGTMEGSYVEIDRRRPLKTKNVNFLDRYAFETRGIWHMTEDAMAGPFLNYTFYDEQQDRIYMIDGMVFAPGYDKREFLRQIEVIAHTFRTKYEVEQSTTASNKQTQ